MCKLMLTEQEDFSYKKNAKKVVFLYTSSYGGEILVNILIFCCC
jgi:hypothetical protein